MFYILSADSRAILVEYPDEQQYYPDYRGRYVEEQEGQRRKVKRTHSDLTGTKRKKQKNRRAPSPSFTGNHQQSKPTEERAKRTASVEVYERRVDDRKTQNVDEQVKTLDFKDQDFPPECATDSAKLRAIQQDKARDQDLASTWANQKDDLKLNLPRDEEEGDLAKTRHYYEYSGNLKNEKRDPNMGVARAYVSPSDVAKTQGKVNKGFTNDEIRTSTARKDMDTPRTDYMDSHRKVEKAESNADGE